MIDPAHGLSWRGAGATLAAGALIVAVYVPGLSGGFLLDDFDNLRPLSRYLAGQLDWMAVVTGNTSGPLGRPLAMLSLVLDARLFGMDAAAFDRSNLLLHLACAVLLALIVRRLFERDNAIPAGAATWLAGGVALTWAVLPLQVGVVLYPVQRMAILCGLFTLAALLCYVSGRARIAQGRAGANLLLYFAFPALTVLATLAKENGVLAPLLAAALEIGWFAHTASPAESRQRRRFFLCMVGLPAALAAVLLAVDPGYLPRGYAGRNFTLVDRLLSEPRVLWDYVVNIVLPFGPGMGLVHDEFPKSTGLLSPWTTLPAIAAWLFAVATAWRLRGAAPGILGGLLLFLAAHALESSVFPLELYFEHRNYLASSGILLALAALGRLLAGSGQRPSEAFSRVIPVLLLALPLSYAAATLARASVWGDPPARMAQALIHSPSSPRLRAQAALDAARQGDLAAALAHIDMAAGSVVAPPTRTLDLWRLVAACVARQPLAPDVLARATASREPRITLSDMISFQALAQNVESSECTIATTGELATLGLAMLAGTRQDPGAQEVWRTRYNLARMLAAGGQLDAAAGTAERAWADSRWSIGIGILVFRLHAARDDLAAAGRALDRLRAGAPANDRQLARTLDSFATFLAAPETPGTTVR